MLTEPSIRKHADLVSYVLPCSGSSDSLELGAQHCAHFFDSGHHDLPELFLPLCEESRIGEDGASDEGAVLAGIRVRSPDDDSE